MAPQPNQRITHGDNVFGRRPHKHHLTFLQSLVPTGSIVSDENIFEIAINQNKGMPTVAIFFFAISRQNGEFIISAKFDSNWPSSFRKDPYNVRCQLRCHKWMPISHVAELQISN